MPKQICCLALALTLSACSEDDTGGSTPSGRGDTVGGDTVGGDTLSGDFDPGPAIRRVDNNDCFQFAAGGTPPATLTDTGCFTDVPTHAPAPMLIPFTVNSPLWTDGATKERYLVLPLATSTVTLPDDVTESLDTGSWDLPDGTILIKTFKLPFAGVDEPVETRFLVKRDSTTWEGYTYKWNAAFTEADLLPMPGEVANYMIDDGMGGTVAQDYFFPSRANCLECHNFAADFSLGLRVVQINGDFDYGGGRVENQMDAMDAAGVFATSPGPASGLSTMPNALDTTADLGERARAYMQANCSHCHQPGSIGAFMDLRYDTAMDMTNTVCINANMTVPELMAPPQPVRIWRGDHMQSMMWQRINRRGAQQMPRIGSLIVDTEGTQVIADWIDAMTPMGCP